MTTRHRRHRLGVVAMVGAVLVLVAASLGAAAPPDGKPGRDRASILAYWTAERIARAVPREVAPDRLPSFRPRELAKPGGGGGGSGGGSVTGATYTATDHARRTVGKVLFTMGGVDYVCSGAVVRDTAAGTGANGRSLVLTAGHCVFDEAGGAFATNWVFMPQYVDGGSIGGTPRTFNCADLATPGCWVADALVTTTAWAAGGGSLAGFDEDYAFAVVGLGGHGGVELDVTVGSNPIAFTGGGVNATYTLLGYPAASPYDGERLVYCSGKAIADSWGGTTDAGVNCNMTGGSSGGPWFLSFSQGNATSAGTLNSVNSFRYTIGKYTKYMWGPRFDAWTQKTYLAAQAATGDLRVDESGNGYPGDPAP